ncbi:MAG: hypothetical protein GW854_14135 [Erythrobacter sp.]|nr:hypothetical protein [Erythrobacter sp.]
MANPLVRGPLNGAVEPIDDIITHDLQSIATKRLQSIAAKLGFIANRALDANAPGELP